MRSRACWGLRVKKGERGSHHERKRTYAQAGLHCRSVQRAHDLLWLGCVARVEQLDEIVFLSEGRVRAAQHDVAGLEVFGAPGRPCAQDAFGSVLAWRQANGARTT